MIAARSLTRWEAPDVGDLDLDAARGAVRGLAAELDLENQLSRYAGHLWDGRTDRPFLHLDDTSAIPFLEGVLGVEEYAHRARTRARDGDLFAAVTPPTDGYEQYCRGRLGLGRAEFLPAAAVANPLAVADACAEGEAFERIAARTRAAGGITIHPYMGIETVWSLAERISAAAGAPVSVIGPPPPVTWIANDKGHMAEVVARVLGEDHLVETRTARSVKRMTELLLELAGRHSKVALKRLRCASGMGNAIFDSRSLLDAGPGALAGEIRGFLERTEWAGREEVLVVAWEETEISPSTQLWIPPLGSGPPRLDGIYEQLLEGPERIFLGSRPSGLPAAVNRRLAAAGLELGAAMQELGYVGRCSFDYLLVGEPEGDSRLLVVECNGRWGGTSTPMSLLDRLISGSRPPYRAQDFVHPRLVGMPFRGLLDRVGEEAYDSATGRGRYIFYNVGPLARHGKLDVIALGATQAEAEAAMEEELPRLLGL